MQDLSVFQPSFVKETPKIWDKLFLFSIKLVPFLVGKISPFFSKYSLILTRT